jgi:SAM-dependent methyltransferase
LDVGANFGHFLSLAKDYYQISGLDVTDQGAKWARKNLGVEIHLASIYDPPAEWKESFNAVTCWDVIEHLPNPSRAVEQLRNLLKPGGLLFLSTPDAGSLVAKLLRGYWHYIDPIQHHCLFTRKCLAKLLEESEFEIVEMTSFGHYYKIRYVMDRLSYLHPGPSRIFAPLKLLPSSVLNKHVYLKLGDVMGIVATKSNAP